MMLGLTGKVVVVTGGSKGIGLACARAFLQEGAKVGIIARSQENLDRARAELGRVASHAADLVDPVQAVVALDALEAELGPVDVLVNSAGAARRVPPDDLTPERWRAAFNAKLFTLRQRVRSGREADGGAGLGCHRQSDRERRQGGGADSHRRRSRERGADTLPRKVDLLRLALFAADDFGLAWLLLGRWRV